MRLDLEPHEDLLKRQLNPLIDQHHLAAFSLDLLFHEFEEVLCVHAG
jgi:hypothetical protein